MSEAVLNPAYQSGFAGSSASVPHAKKAPLNKELDEVFSSSQVRDAHIAKRMAASAGETPIEKEEKERFLRRIIDAIFRMLQSIWRSILEAVGRQQEDAENKQRSQRSAMPNEPSGTPFSDEPGGDEQSVGDGGEQAQDAQSGTVTASAEDAEKDSLAGDDDGFIDPEQRRQMPNQSGFKKLDTNAPYPQNHALNLNSQFLPGIKDGSGLLRPVGAAGDISDRLTREIIPRAVDEAIDAGVDAGIKTSGERYLGESASAFFQSLAKQIGTEQNILKEKVLGSLRSIMIDEYGASEEEAQFDSYMLIDDLSRIASSGDANDSADPEKASDVLEKIAQRGEQSLVMDIVAIESLKMAMNKVAQDLEVGFNWSDRSEQSPVLNPVKTFRFASGDLISPVDGDQPGRSSQIDSQRQSGGFSKMRGG